MGEYRFVLHIKAPPERVFEAWIDLARMPDTARAKIDFATPAKTQARTNALFALYDAATTGPR